jgi:hypothetical protein
MLDGYFDDYDNPSTDDQVLYRFEWKTDAGTWSDSGEKVADKQATQAAIDLTKAAVGARVVRVRFCVQRQVSTTVTRKTGYYYAYWYLQN